MGKFSQYKRLLEALNPLMGLELDDELASEAPVFKKTRKVSPESIFDIELKQVIKDGEGNLYYSFRDKTYRCTLPDESYVQVGYHNDEYGIYEDGSPVFVFHNHNEYWWASIEYIYRQKGKLISFFEYKNQLDSNYDPAYGDKDMDSINNTKYIIENFLDDESRYMFKKYNLYIPALKEKMLICPTNRLDSSTPGEWGFYYNSYGINTGEKIKFLTLVNYKNIQPINKLQLKENPNMTSTLGSGFTFDYNITK